MSQKEAFEAWWREQTRRGDPARRTNLVEDAFNAGWVKGMIGPLERIGVLEDALRGAMKLPRPWMDGGVTFEEWSASFDKIAAALEPPAPKPTTRPGGPCRAVPEELCSWPMCEC